MVSVRAGVTLLRAYVLGSLVAAPTILARELYLDDGIPPITRRRRSADTRLAGRTGRLWLAPINLEVLGVNAVPLAGSPVIVEACRPQQSDAIVVATVDCWYSTSSEVHLMPFAQDPECRHENPMLLGRAIYVIGPLVRHEVSWVNCLDHRR